MKVETDRTERHPHRIFFAFLSINLFMLYPTRDYTLYIYSYDFGRRESSPFVAQHHDYASIFGRWFSEIYNGDLQSDRRCHDLSDKLWNVRNRRS